MQLLGLIQRLRGFCGRWLTRKSLHRLQMPPFVHARHASTWVHCRCHVHAMLTTSGKGWPWAL